MYLKEEKDLAVGDDVISSEEYKKFTAHHVSMSKKYADRPTGQHNRKKLFKQLLIICPRLHFV